MFKILYRLLLTVIAIAVNLSSSYAYTPESILKERLNVTPSTPESDVYARPPYFNNSNNLARKPSSPFLAQGQFLLIEGRVNGLFDIPIEGATICIWQTNSRGRYNHLVEDKSDATQYDMDFTGNGCATANNLGQFSFITRMPTWYGNRTIHIHTIVWSEYLQNTTKSIELEMYFPGHPRNEIDNKYRQLDPKSRSLTTCSLKDINPINPLDGKIAYFTIKLDVLHPKKGY